MYGVILFLNRISRACPSNQNFGSFRYTRLSDGGEEASDDEVTSSYSFRNWYALENETAANLDLHEEISSDCSLNILVDAVKYSIDHACLPKSVNREPSVNSLNISHGLQMNLSY